MTILTIVTRLSALTIIVTFKFVVLGILPDTHASLSGLMG